MIESSSFLDSISSFVSLAYHSRYLILLLMSVFNKRLFGNATNPYPNRNIINNNPQAFDVVTKNDSK